MRALKVVLWIGAVVCLLSVVGLVLPFSAFQSLARAFAGGGLPQDPIFVYAVRVMSATYVAIGVYLLFLARDPLRYGRLVPFTGIACLFIGAVCAIAGTMARLPAKWFVGDCAGCLAFGVLVLALWRRASAPSSGSPQVPPVREA